MTINELIAVLSGYLILSIIHWKPEKKLRLFLYSFSFLFFYVILNLISGNNLLLLNLLFLLGLKLILEERYMGAGIIFALLTINIETFLIPWIVVLIHTINKKAWNFALWFLITVLLLGLAASLVITDWPIFFLREILRNPLLVDLGFPGTIISQWSKEAVPWLWNGLALIALGLLFYELLFYENDKDRFLWKLCLTLVLNPLIWMHANLDSMITLLLPFELVFFQWLTRDKRIGTLLMVSISILFSFGLLGLSIFTQSIIIKNQFSLFYYLFPIVILLINLYWMRWWMKANEGINIRNK